MVRGMRSPADQLLKALQGDLKQSTSALKRIYGKQIKNEHEVQFQRSMQYVKIKKIDLSVPSSNFRKNMCKLTW